MTRTRGEGLWCTSNSAEWGNREKQRQHSRWAVDVYTGSCHCQVGSRHPGAAYTAHQSLLDTNTKPGRKLLRKDSSLAVSVNKERKFTAKKTKQNKTPGSQKCFFFALAVPNLIVTATVFRSVPVFTVISEKDLTHHCCWAVKQSGPVYQLNFKIMCLVVWLIFSAQKLS